MVERPIGEEVASDLLRGELIPWHVVPERLDDPVAIGPDGAIVVDVDPVSIRITGGIQPMTGEMLRAGRSGEQLVSSFVDCRLGVRRVGFHEGLDIRRCRRQARDVEMHAAEEPCAAILGVGFETTGIQFFRNEVIDRVGRPIVAGRGDTWLFDGRE